MKEIIIYSNVIHSFSRTLAAKYGVNAAIVLGYIGFRIGVSPNEREGKHWFYDTLDSIAQHYPYLGRSAIYTAIQRLTGKHGPLIVGHFNKRKGDKTNWYAFRYEATAELLKTKLLYFKVENAAFYGIPAAVLLNNLAYHINYERQINPNFRFKALSASYLASILPFSRSTLQRALTLLVEEGVLLFRKTTGTALPTEYGFAVTEDLKEYLAGPNPNRGALEQVPANTKVSKVQPAQARIQQMGGSNPNKVGSNPNKLGSNPNDVTIIINPFRNYSLEETVWKNAVLRSSVVAFKHSPRKTITVLMIAQFVRRTYCAIVKNIANIC